MYYTTKSHTLIATDLLLKRENVVNLFSLIHHAANGSINGSLPLPHVNIFLGKQFLFVYLNLVMWERWQLPEQ
jgi:hypothetical protein